MKSTIFMLLVLAIIIGSWGAGQANFDHPNDYYAHGSIMFGCGLIWQGIFSLADEEANPWLAKHPVWGAFVLCNGVGLLKEFVWDNRPDWRDIGANNIGLGGSIIILEW